MRDPTLFEAQSDLVWFFNRADADCGLQSNWGAMVNAAHCGRSDRPYEDPYTEAFLMSISRRRVIETRLNRCTLFQQKVLYGVHSHDIFLHPGMGPSPWVSKVLGAKAGVTYLYIDSDRLESLCERAQTGGLNGTERILLAQLRVRAEQDYRKAMSVYLGKADIK